jgi:hypothetical protein
MLVVASSAFNQPRVSDPGKQNMDAGSLRKFIDYPEELIGIKSGFVVCSPQKDEIGKLYPMILYSSDASFLNTVDSFFNNYPAETMDLLLRYKNDVLIFEFITFTTQGHQKIYHGGNRHFFNELSAGRKQFFFTLECWERVCYK